MPNTEPCTQVLVVDDDPVVRRVVVTMLRAAGFGIEEATSGREGAARLENKRFDVVVSDVDMPDGTGLELLRGIRRRDLDVPVILVTGKPDVRSASQAIEHGVFRYLMKPIDFETLVDAIRKASRAHALARIRRDAFAAAGGDGMPASDLVGLEVRFENAMEKQWTAYQPIVGARTGALFGVEALLRTDEPSMPSPLDVLRAASRLGRLRELGRRCRLLAARDVAGTRPGTFLFNNLHPDDLFDDELADPDSPLGAIATRVILEITERAALEATTALRDRLAALRDMGYRFAIDDIGAGYSGLNSFAEVMPEVVKVDMALVRNIHESQVRQRTVRLLCNLVHESSGLVVGEGVETAEERDCLLELGCDLFQGYFFGKPAPTIPG
jgi:EAL domain-containing protein (putative c-di-GMP-specific phosphodiesterase class I)/CheY-like chemotaxis protein